jgi:hypothetical protein
MPTGYDCRTDRYSPLCAAPSTVRALLRLFWARRILLICGLTGLVEFELPRARLLLSAASVSDIQGRVRRLTRRRAMRGKPLQRGADHRGAARARGGGEDRGVVPASRDFERDLLHLWTALPWQEGCRAWSGGNRLQTSIRRRQVDGTPKWDIRSHSPRQMVGLEGHYKSQGLSVPVRSVSPFTDPSSNPCSSFTQRADTVRHWSARPRLPVHSCWRPRPSRGYIRAAGEDR